MPFDLRKSVTGQLSNVTGTPGYLHRSSSGSYANWWRATGTEWLITLSTEAGLDASEAAFTAFLRDTVGLSLGVADGYFRQAINFRGATVAAQLNAQRGAATTALGGRASFAVLMYTAAIASPAGNWGAVVFYFGLAGVQALMANTTAAELPLPLSRTSGIMQILNADGSRLDAEATYGAMARYVPGEDDEEEEVVEGTPPPAVVEPPAEEMTIGGGPAMSMVSPVVIYPGGVGGGTPNPTGGASVALVPISGAGTLARFVVTLPGFARTATGFSFTNNAVARAAWTITKAALAGLGLTQLVDLIDELADDAVLLFRLGGGGTDYSVGDMIGNATVTKVWEANDVPFLALSDGRLGARKGTGMWRFWRPRRPIVLYSDGAKDLKTGIRAGKALIKQAREMRKLSNALLGTQKEKRKAPAHYHPHETGTQIRNIEVT